MVAREGPLGLRLPEDARARPDEVVVEQALVEAPQPPLPVERLQGLPGRRGQRGWNINKTQTHRQRLIRWNPLLAVGASRRRKHCSAFPARASVLARISFWIRS